LSKKKKKKKKKKKNTGKWEIRKKAQKPLSIGVVKIRSAGGGGVKARSLLAGVALSAVLGDIEPDIQVGIKEGGKI